MAKPNILLILVDSLRADQYFNKSISLSVRDKLISQGIYFKETFSSSDYTETGFMSILTGRYPLNASNSGTSYYNIFKNFPNIVSTLKESNYNCFCTIESALSKFGYSADFENSIKEYDRTKTGLFSGLGEDILKNIASFDSNKPWFYFVHLDDLHIPVKLPERFPPKKYVERYGIMISEIDSWIGKIIEKIDLNSTIVVITADHGDYLIDLDESFVEDSLKQTLKNKLKSKISQDKYDFLSKMKRNTNKQFKKTKAKTFHQKQIVETRTGKNRFLFDDLLHVPLLFIGNNIPNTGIVKNLVRTVDIFPTICDILQISPPTKLDGESLKPIFENNTVDENSVYLENTTYNNQQSHQASIGIRTSSHKYFRNIKNPTKNIHLYDLRNDPLEEKNIADSNPDIIKNMESLIDNLRKNISDYDSAPTTSEDDKKVEDELRKLGYI